jgi:O-acetyl-ADP-ribose deacetylase (regulator of RNase III)
MPIIRVINGDILESNEKVIVHQSDCTTVKTHGLALSIIKKFQWADIYDQQSMSIKRIMPRVFSIPGTIQYIKNYGTGQVIICLFSQWCPGKIGKYPFRLSETYKDTKENREKWFE